MQGEQGQTGNEFSGRARDVVQAHTVHVHGPPPAAAPSPLPRMAPAAPTRFVLREALGRRITDALRPDALVLLAGGGGYGKTAMAGWAARAFTGGVLWAELGQRPGIERIVASLAELTAALTGSRTQTYADVHAAAGAFRTALAAAENRTLLVVDDAWNADDVRPFLVGEGLTVLVTTRRPGLLDGTEIAVDAMSDAEAVAMLGRGSSTELRPLLDRVGRWPLALAMLRRLVNMDGMTVEEAVTAVLDELDGAGPAALDDLHDPRVERGIARTLELSLMDLPDDASRDHYISLAAFPEGEMIPYWLLSRLWNLSPLRTRNEARRFVSRSLAQLPHPDGLQMHDLPRETLRRADPARMAAVSKTLLERLRPEHGWHAMPDTERAFLHQLTYHLHQAGQNNELGALFHDMRFLVTRLSEQGPAVLEADLALYTAANIDDNHAQELALLIRQEGHLFSGQKLSAADVETTLASRLFGRPLMVENIAKVPLLPTHPLPDRDGKNLLRAVSLRAAGGSIKAMAWHPVLPLVATAGSSPAVEIYNTETWRSEQSLRLSTPLINDAHWSPDGKLLALIGTPDHPPQNANKIRRDKTALKTVYPHVLTILDATTWKEIDAISLIPPDQLPPTIAWSPDSRAIAIIWAHKEIRLWAPGSDDTLHTLPSPSSPAPGSYDALDWHPKHGLLAHARGDETGSGSLVHWPNGSMYAPPTVWQHRSLSGEVDYFRWRPGGESLALSCNTECIVVFPTSQIIARWPRENRHSPYLKWSLDGTELATTDWKSRSTRLQRWTVPADNELRIGAPIVSGFATVRTATQEPRQKRLLWRHGNTFSTAQDDAILKIWIGDLTAPIDTSDHSARLRDVTWHNDESGEVITMGNGRYFVDLLSGNPRLLQPPPLRAQWRKNGTTIDHPLSEPMVRRSEKLTTAQAFRLELPSNQKIYTLGRHNEPLRWHISEHTQHQLRPDLREFWWSGVCFTPTGSALIAAINHDSRLSIASWDSTTDFKGPLIPQWSEGASEPTYGSRSLRCITASKTHLALIIDPNLIGLFAIHDLQPVCWLRTNAPIRGADFSPSGGQLAVAGDAGLYLFSVAPLPPGNRT
ncbi:hypothetical protein [Streptomyces harbinensis]|uniref:hypothetical protein n=1 Tax=Streptomyces harbinensis TaxID=1176198 RepID=UPI0034E00AE5